MAGTLQYRTLTNCMYRFPLAIKLPVVIWPVQCWKAMLKIQVNKLILSLLLSLLESWKTTERLCLFSLPVRLGLILLHIWERHLRWDSYLGRTSLLVFNTARNASRIPDHHFWNGETTPHKPGQKYMCRNEKGGWIFRVALSSMCTARIREPLVGAEYSLRRFVKSNSNILKSHSKHKWHSEQCWITL